MRSLLLITFLLGSFFVSAQEVFYFEVQQRTVEEEDTVLQTGVRDRSGSWVIPMSDYEMINWIGGDLFIIRQESGYGLMNRAGKKLLFPEFEKIMVPLNEHSFIAVKKEGKWGFYNRKGMKVIDHQYGKVSNFRNGTAKVMKDKELIAVKTSGRELPVSELRNPKFWPLGGELEVLNHCDPNIHPKESEGRVGVKNLKTGEWEVSPQYQEIQMYCEGRLIAKQKGKWGVVDLDGREVIPFVYHKIYLDKPY